jgi:predicted nucleic acid-binding protein
LIYLDSSVVIAELLSETRTPSPRLWENSLIASRLVHYEVFTRLHRAGLGSSHQHAASALLERVAVIEMLPSVLKRTLEPFPFPLRTLDALHLATLVFVARSGHDVALASYDMRLIECARAMDVSVEEL